MEELLHKKVLAAELFMTQSGCVFDEVISYLYPLKGSVNTPKKSYLTENHDLAG